MEGNNSTQCQAILIVEDDKGIRDALKFALESENYIVFTAENGQLGLDLLPTIPKPCLILLDLMMPVMNGWDFADALEKDTILATIPVVVLSAYSDQTKPVKAKEIIKKPFDLEVLFQTIKRLCPKKNDMTILAGQQV